MDMQHLLYIVPISVSSQSLVMCNKEYAGTSTTPVVTVLLVVLVGERVVLYLLPGPYLDPDLDESLCLDAAAAADGKTKCSNKIESNATGSQFSIILTIFPLPTAILAASM